MLVLLLACGTEVQVAPEDTTQTVQERLGLTDTEASDILDFLNDCDTTLARLDDDVGLDSDAAAALVQHRDAGDGRCGSGDDAPYATLDEVDLVPQVGDQTILAILAWLDAGSVVHDGEWEGVTLSVDEQAVVLEIANDASEAVLDTEVGLASDEAANIVGARPIADMDALAAVPQVGATAIRRLLDYVPLWDG